MKRETINQLCGDFERLVQVEEASGIEFWMARDLQLVLGYDRWENFSKVIEKAIVACKNAGYDAKDHFLEATKMIELGKGGQREIDDYLLTRYACYLMAENGDPSKEPIAFAQTYFAIQTRRAELIEKRLADVERVQARKKLTLSEKELSGLIFERTKNEKSFGLIRSKGDQALFGGKTTQQMKDKLRVPDSRPLADFLPTITIKAKDFANEITNFNIRKDDLKSEGGISYEHVKNNRDVRKVLTDRGILPENLPPAEDAKKIERRLASEEKKYQGAPKVHRAMPERDTRNASLLLMSAEYGRCPGAAGTMGKDAHATKQPGILETQAGGEPTPGSAGQPDAPLARLAGAAGLGA